MDKMEKLSNESKGKLGNVIEDPLEEAEDLIEETLEKAEEEDIKQKIEIKQIKKRQKN